MTITAVTLQAQEFGGYTATGTISSTYQSMISNADVAAVCTNGTGAVIGGGYTYLDADVVGGGKMPFERQLNVSKKP